MIKIRHPRDFWAGMLFMLFGAATIWFARGYAFGSAAKMGPGYFPTVLGGILVLLGLIISARGLVVDGHAVAPFHWRPLVLVLVSVVLFGAILPQAGLVVSIFALIVLSALAGHEFRIREVMVLAAILTIGSVAVFIYGLKLQFPVWPQWI